MTRVEEIENHVKELTPEELEAFRTWFAEFDNAAWDQQIEADAKAGKLSAAISRALADHDAGRSTPL